MTVRATTMQNPKAAEIFDAFKARGVDPMLGQPLSEISIRGGIQAFVASAKYGEDEIVSVKWLERPALQVELVTYNLPPDRALDYANKLTLPD